MQTNLVITSFTGATEAFRAFCVPVKATSSIFILMMRKESSSTLT